MTTTMFFVLAGSITAVTHEGDRCTYAAEVDVAGAELVVLDDATLTWTGPCDGSGVTDRVFAVVQGDEPTITPMLQVAAAPAPADTFALDMHWSDREPVSLFSVNW